MDAVVSAAGINFSFGAGATKQNILEDIDVEINAGEIVLLSGPSGSGKTTLLTLLGCLRSLQCGELWVLGTDLSNSTEIRRTQVRKQIGFIFQQHNLLPFLTAEQNVQLGLNVDGRESREKAGDALEALGLGNRKRYLPKQLSGGQCQRVAVARALVRSPKLILADEPTASLDAESGLLVSNLLRQHADVHRCGVMLVTHDPRIKNVADRETCL